MAKKDLGGRPTKMTDIVVMKLEQAFAIGASDTEACSYADISRNTFYVWLKNKPEYQDRIDELREKPILKARQTVVKSLENPQYATWFLERKMKKEFAARTEYTGANGEAIQVQTLTEEDKEHLSSLLIHDHGSTQ